MARFGLHLEAQDARAKPESREDLAGALDYSNRPSEDPQFPKRSMDKDEVELMKATNSSDSEDQEKEPEKTEEEEADTVYPTGSRLALIMFAISLSVFLAALDATIIATAIPTITTVFKSLDDVEWYTGGYLLMTSAFQLPFGRSYALLNTKWTFLTSVLIFELGSVVCGSAPTSIALIIGRCIQGIGSAGLFGGAFIIIAESVPLAKRSIFAGFIGGTFAVAAAVGPVLGECYTHCSSPVTNLD
jgi:hypothetical protein